MQRGGTLGAALRLGRTTCGLWAWLALAGCSRSDGVAASAPEPSPPRAEAEQAPVAAQLGPRLSRPAVQVVAALGDLHGDLDATKRVLRLVGAIDEQDAWSGGAMVVVHTGDSVDRGDDDRAVVEFLDALKPKAKAAGGELIATLGNHEMMNVAGDFRYVTPAAFEDFVSDGGRGAAFGPGGPYARRFAERPIMVRVGDTLFVHGGILPKHVAYGLDRMDRELRDWMLAKRLTPPDIVAANDGPLWTRVYSLEGGDADCASLSEVLTALNAKRMVVGHTVQAGGVTSACDGKVWRIDVGMSKAYGGQIQAIEIRGDSVTVRK